MGRSSHLSLNFSEKLQRKQITLLFVGICLSFFAYSSLIVNVSAQARNSNGERTSSLVLQSDNLQSLPLEIPHVPKIQSSEFMLNFEEDIVNRNGNDEKKSESSISLDKWFEDTSETFPNRIEDRSSVNDNDENLLHLIQFSQNIGFLPCGDIKTCNPSNPSKTLSSLFGNCTFLTLGDDIGVKPKYSLLNFQTPQKLIVFLLSSKLYFKDSMSFYDFLQKELIAEQTGFCNNPANGLNQKKSKVEGGTIFDQINQYCEDHADICRIESGIGGNGTASNIYPPSSANYTLTYHNFDYERYPYSFWVIINPNDMGRSKIGLESERRSKIIDERLLLETADLNTEIVYIKGIFENYDISTSTILFSTLIWIIISIICVYHLIFTTPMAGKFADYYNQSELYRKHKIKEIALQEVKANMQIPTGGGVTSPFRTDNENKLFNLNNQWNTIGTDSDGNEVRTDGNVNIGKDRSSSNQKLTSFGSSSSLSSLLKRASSGSTIQCTSPHLTRASSGNQMHGYNNSPRLNATTKVSGRSPRNRNINVSNDSFNLNDRNRNSTNMASFQLNGDMNGTNDANIFLLNDISMHIGNSDLGNQIYNSNDILKSCPPFLSSYSPQGGATSKMTDKDQKFLMARSKKIKNSTNFLQKSLPSIEPYVTCESKFDELVNKENISNLDYSNSGINHTYSPSSRDRAHYYYHNYHRGRSKTASDIYSSCPSCYADIGNSSIVKSFQRKGSILNPNNTSLVDRPPNTDKIFSTKPTLSRRGNSEGRELRTNQPQQNSERIHFQTRDCRLYETSKAGFPHSFFDPHNIYENDQRTYSSDAASFTSACTSSSSSSQGLNKYSHSNTKPTTIIRNTPSINCTHPPLRQLRSVDDTHDERSALKDNPNVFNHQPLPTIYHQNNLHPSYDSHQVNARSNSMNFPYNWNYDTSNYLNMNLNYDNGYIGPKVPMTVTTHIVNTKENREGIPKTNSNGAEKKTGSIYSTFHGGMIKSENEQKKSEQKCKNNKGEKDEEEDKGK